MGLFLLGLPIITVILCLLVKNQKLLYALGIVSTVVMLAVSLLLTREVMAAGSVSYELWGGFFYVDALSMIFLDIVALLCVAVAVYSGGYLEQDLKNGSIDTGKIHIYYILLFTFIFTMVLALTVRNMGIMWVAIEATTLASAFLVGFYNNPKGIEAAWKYVIICSVGIALAFLGVIFLHLASMDSLAEHEFLNWTALMANAAELNQPVLKLAFIFILVGFGTKAGLAPMHTWLPPAHSQAPSPISALLSGVLLNSAMYGIVRAEAVVNLALGDSGYAGKILMGVGLLSVLTACIMIISQKKYKALLAYSSIEHMGIIAFAFGVFSPAAIFAALFHTVNHSFTKSMLFLSAGNILQKFETSSIDKIRGILKVLPVTGTAFLLGLLGIAGTPPFSVFASEFSVLAAVFSEGSFVAGGVLAVLLALIFAGIVYMLFKMFYGDTEGLTDPHGEAIVKGETNKAGTAVIVLLLIVIVVTGLWLPQPLLDLINMAVQVLTAA
ncbi:MAG: hydrogenase 4 subunit F [Bacillota bacterium]|jgi:hydrogenase-4 component F